LLSSNNQNNKMTCKILNQTDNSDNFRINFTVKHAFLTKNIFIYVETLLFSPIHCVQSDLNTRQWNRRLPLFIPKLNSFRVLSIWGAVTPSCASLARGYQYSSPTDLPDSERIPP
jgi:hypothetical protein